MKRLRRPLLALVGLSILAIAIVVVGGRGVFDRLLQFDALALAGASAALVVAGLLGAWNCYQVTELSAQLAPRVFLPIFWRSWAIGISLPGQVGDFIATLWQLKDREINLPAVAGRLLVDKLVTLTLGLAMLACVPAVLGSAVGLAVGLVLALGFVLLLAWWVIRWGLQWRPDKELPGWLARLRLALGAALSTPPRLIAANVAITVCKFIVTGVAYWLLIRQLDASPPTLATTTIVAQSAGLVAYLPISFNGIGTVEVSAITLFGRIGVPAASVLAVYLVLRVLTLAIAWSPAILARGARTR